MSGSLSSCCCCHPVGIPCPAWSGCRWMLFTPGSNSSDSHWDRSVSYRCLTSAKSSVPQVLRVTGTSVSYRGLSSIKSPGPGPQELLGPCCVIHKVTPVPSLHSPGPQELHQASPVLLGPLCEIVSIPGVEDLQCHNEREKLAAVHQQWTMSIAQCAHLRM